MASTRSTIVLLAAALGALLANAATLEPLSLDQLTARSTAVVRGRVAAERVERAGALLYTVKTVRVESLWKGGNGARTVEVALPGGELGAERQRFGGAPALESGREYVLFLWTGPSGRTQVTGYSQGVFEVHEEAGRPARAVRRPSADVLIAPGGGADASAGAGLDMPLAELAARVAANAGEAASR